MKDPTITIKLLESLYEFMKDKDINGVEVDGIKITRDLYFKDRLPLTPSGVNLDKEIKKQGNWMDEVNPLLAEDEGLKKAE